MQHKPYYRSRVILTVLSEEPLDDLDIETILYKCNEENMVLGAVDLATTQIDRQAMDTELILAGSDPSFFSDEIGDPLEMNGM